MATYSRPTSPHLGIYKPQISSVLSILHRFTGIGLYAGALLLALWLWTAAYHAPCFQWLHAQGQTWYGQALLWAWVAAFFYHFSNGMRHLWWDTGRGFSLREVNISGWLTVLFTAGMTAFTWWISQ